MAKTRVFISFDYDHDARQKDLLVGQAAHPDSPFEFADWSIKEAIDSNWRAHARRRIRAVNVVCVLCGRHMDTAVGVTAELSIVHEENKPYFLLAAYSTDDCKKPVGAKPSDKIYVWTWDNLKKLVAGSR